MADKIILFTRYPEPGTTKTRLIPLLGEIRAANFQKNLTERVFQAIKELKKNRSFVFEVHFCGGDVSLMSGWLGSNLIYVPQVEKGDIGQKMAYAFEQGLREKNQILLIGADCPDITARILRQGLNFLKKYDLVLGPAEDGGYYAIGLKKFYPELFEGVNWGSSEVLAQTMEIARSLNLRVAKLAILSDIDEMGEATLSFFESMAKLEDKESLK